VVIVTALIATDILQGWLVAQLKQGQVRNLLFSVVGSSGAGHWWWWLGSVRCPVVQGKELLAFKKWLSFSGRKGLLKMRSGLQERWGVQFTEPVEELSPACCCDV